MHRKSDGLAYVSLLRAESPPRISTPESDMLDISISRDSVTDAHAAYHSSQPRSTRMHHSSTNTPLGHSSVITVPIAFRSTSIYRYAEEPVIPGLFDSKQGLMALNDSNMKTFLSTTESSDQTVSPERGLKFWMCIGALMMGSFLIVLDLSGLSTALPNIVNDLHGTEFEWIGSSFALAATAFLPLSGALAQVFGRKSVLLTQVFLFGLGSALCGAATSMGLLIGGRTIQGVGSGGIASLTQIIISDLVPLQDRGSFNGLIALSYAFGTAMSPVIAGILAERGLWRWFFYMNIPIAVATMLVIVLFLDVRVPRSSLKEKLIGLDWIGNGLVIASTTCVVIALTWGGVKYEWSSVNVLVPLLLGLFGLCALMYYEFRVPDTPVIPFEVLSSRTGISGYIQAFFGSFSLFCTVYYLPLYFQACKGASPIMSGVDVLTLACGLMPFAMAAGISIAKTGRYRPQLWLSWCFLMAGAGIFSTIKAESQTGVAIGFQVFSAVGLGILQTAPFFPVLAPIDISLNANALAFFMFVRFFSQVWGISIGGTVIQNSLKQKLPEALVKKLPEGTSIVYSLVEIIPTLDRSLQPSVRNAFAESLQTFWQVLIGIAGMGFVASWFMEGLPLHTSMDRRFALRNGEQNARAELPGGNPAYQSNNKV